jgi:small subunit ribosomal protein S6
LASTSHLLPLTPAGAAQTEGEVWFVTRRYEVVYIFDSALEEPAVTERLARFHGLLGDGVEVSVSHWGKRTLNYRTKHHDTGYYVVAQFEASPPVLPEFERAVKLDEGVLRYLVVLAEAAPPPAAPAAEPAPAGAAEEEEE